MTNFPNSLNYSYIWDDSSQSRTTLLSPEELELREIVTGLKDGDFELMGRLSPLIVSKSSEIRMYAVRVLADAGGHENFNLFSEALRFAEGVKEHNHLLLCLGESFCLQAIPLIIEIAKDFENPDVYGFASQALDTIIPVEGLNEFSFTEENLEILYADAVSALAPDSYYYKGSEMHIGDVSKEFIVAATTAYHSKKGAILVAQPQILENFSGEECPLKIFDMVDDQMMSTVSAYVKFISKIDLDWQRGAKYFWRKEV